MGSSCSKRVAVKAEEELLESEVKPEPCEVFSEFYQANHFSIKLDSYSTTTNRLGRTKSSVTKGCKSVVITQIRLEMNDSSVSTRLAKNYSILHMPVLHLPSADVKFQLPELLPLNLCCDTPHVIYSFIHPDTLSDSSIFLNGKVGSKQISVQQQIRKADELSTDEFAQFSKQLEVEISRHEKKIFKGQKMKERSNSSNKGTPYSGLTPVDDSTDSDAEKKMERQKRAKLRRKDTPSHIIPLTQRREPRGVKLQVLKLRAPILAEEEEPLENEADGNNPGPRPENCTHQQKTPEQTAQPQPDELVGLESNERFVQSPGRLTKSCINIMDLTGPQSEIPSPTSLKFDRDSPQVSPRDSPQVSPRDSPQVSPRGKRKKNSIGFKLSKMPTEQVPSTNITTPQAKVAESGCENVDVDNDADDEEDSVANGTRKRKNLRITATQDIESLTTTVPDEIAVETSKQSGDENEQITDAADSEKHEIAMEEEAVEVKAMEQTMSREASCEDGVDKRNSRESENELKSRQPVDGAETNDSSGGCNDDSAFLSKHAMSQDVGMSELQVKDTIKTNLKEECINEDRRLDATKCTITYTNVELVTVSDTIMNASEKLVDADDISAKQSKGENQDCRRTKDDEKAFKSDTIKNQDREENKDIKISDKNHTHAPRDPENIDNETKRNVHQSEVRDKKKDIKVSVKRESPEPENIDNNTENEVSVIRIIHQPPAREKNTDIETTGKGNTRGPQYRAKNKANEVSVKRVVRQPEDRDKNKENEDGPRLIRASTVSNVNKSRTLTAVRRKNISLDETSPPPAVELRPSPVQAFVESNESET